MYLYEVVGPSDYDQTRTFGTYMDARKFRRTQYQGLALIWRLTVANLPEKELVLNILNAEPYITKFELRKLNAWVELEHDQNAWEVVGLLRRRNAFNGY